MNVDVSWEDNILDGGSWLLFDSKFGYNEEGLSGNQMLDRQKVSESLTSTGAMACPSVFGLLANSDHEMSATMDFVGVKDNVGAFKDDHLIVFFLGEMPERNQLSRDLMECEKNIVSVRMMAPVKPVFDSGWYSPKDSDFWAKDVELPGHMVVRSNGETFGYVGIPFELLFNTLFNNDSAFGEIILDRYVETAKTVICFRSEYVRSLSQGVELYRRSKTSSAN